MKAGAKPEQGAGNARSVILGTAGHIDHGKTALVLALTGTDTDRLPEEKSRGITIDLGFAALALTGRAGERFDVSLVDVPGHHAFIRNMLAGAGGIDCVMLVVAADEGIKAQTREHLEICTLLGIGRGVVVLTKSDLVTEERLGEVRAQVAAMLEPTSLRGARVLAASAFTGEGLPELNVALAELVAATPRRSLDHVARLPLDRAFTVRGFGTVVTGTLQAGQLRPEETLLLQPAERSVRVRGLQVHGRTQTRVEAPNRVAVNLVGVEVGEVSRGDTLVLPGTLAATRLVDVVLAPAAGVPLPRHRARVRLHAFTSETLATVLRFDTAEETGSRLVRLRLAKPVLLAPGDRFILRQPSPAATLAGGRVLDAMPLPRQRKPAARAWLQRLQEADAAMQVRLRVERRGVAGISVAALVSETGLTEGALQRRLQPMLAAGEVVTDARAPQTPAHLLTREALTQASALVRKALVEGKGEAIVAAELRSRTRLSPWVFALALAEVARERPVVQSPQGLALGAEGAGAPGQLTPRQQQVEQMYRRAGLASPISIEVSAQLKLPAKELREVVTVLLRAKLLVRLGSDELLVHSGAVAKLTAALQQHRGEPFDVARFKSFTGLTRKHAIPMLEYLDGARVTRNSNGVRTVM